MCDAALQALQLGVADLAKLELRHADDALALRDQLTAVTHKMAVVAGERLEDLQGCRDTIHQRALETHQNTPLNYLLAK